MRALTQIRGVFKKFADMLVQAATHIEVGHGAKPDTTMGALTTPCGIDKLKRHVADTIAKGGKVLCGGQRAKLSCRNF
ncbi:hypothetical protein E4T49_08558 [Aureobasidium sp. EXF-10728]|nr:hypothetical protein E4T49_08558 [Aureobasidium sp. EXF-10728]